MNENHETTAEFEYPLRRVLNHGRYKGQVCEFIGPNDSMEKLTEKDMNEFGWFRAD